MNILRLADFRPGDVRRIWELAELPPEPLGAAVGWSFQGNGIRTRTTFIRAFRDSGCSYTELPNLLQTGERACDIAGYLDPFYDLYVIRDTDHQRLAEFAASSERPVINAMSAESHPCEVLTDAYYVDRNIAPIDQAQICLWGPPTNVLRSWHELAQVLGLSVVHVCGARFHDDAAHVTYRESVSSRADVVITDGWPAGSETSARPLTRDDLSAMGDPRLLPVPPFTIGRELAFDPLGYEGFAGYAQKKLLLPVQRAILRFSLQT